MDYSKINESVQIQFLIELLNEERLERSNLAKSIHLQCGNVAALMRFIEIVDRKFGQNLLTQGQITQIEQIARNIHGELSELQYSIYPTGSYYTGLVSNVQKFIYSCQDKFHTEIEFTCIFNKELAIGKLYEISIYKICIELIEFLCFQKIKQISVRLELKEDVLQIEICRIGKTKAKQLDDLLQKVLSRIYTKLIWQKAMVLPATNWKDRFMLTFSCNPTDKESD